MSKPASSEDNCPSESTRTNNRDFISVDESDLGNLDDDEVSIRNPFESESRSKTALVSSVVSVPDGRGPELDKEIKGYQDTLAIVQSNINKQEMKIAKFGSQVHFKDETELEDLKKKKKGLKLAIEALRKERNLQSRYDNELCIFARLRWTFGVAGEHKSNAEIVAIAETFYPGFFSKESILLGLSPSNLAAKFEGPALIDNEIEKLERLVDELEGFENVRDIQSQLVLVKERLNKLSGAKDALCAKIGETTLLGELV